jgi:hypothetical protein
MEGSQGGGKQKLTTSISKEYDTKKTWESSAHHVLAGQDAATTLLLFAAAIASLPAMTQIIPSMIWLPTFIAIPQGKTESSHSS